MKIIYLHQYFNTPSMAGATRSYEIARRLVRWGHEVQMVTSRRWNAETGCGRTEEAGIHVHWCPVRYSNQMGYLRRLWAFLEFSYLAARKAVALDGDLVFASSTPLTIALPAVYVARKKSIPMVFEVRDLWPETPIAVGALRNRLAIAAARRLERFAYRSAAHVVALSPDMKAGIVATGYPENRVTVVPNSCDLQLFRVCPETGREFRRRHAWLGSRPLIVYAGTLGLVNGADYLVRLAAAVGRRDPEIRFLIIGSGREKDKVREVAKQLGVLNRNLFMQPPLPKREMPAVLSAADIATSTVIDREALWANSANKVFDALAAGRPIAINHQGWLAEMIYRTGCGLVLDPHDLESSAHDLLAAVRDQQWLSRARTAARRVGEERFDRDRLAGLVESVLAAAVRDHGIPEQEKRLAA